MAVAADLLDAAAKTPTNLLPLWQANTLKAKMVAFWQAITDDFLDQTPNDRPVGAWISIIAAFSPSILNYEQPAFSDVGLGTVSTFETSVDYIYRLCKFSYYYTLISSAQKAAILAAYNAQFA